MNHKYQHIGALFYFKKMIFTSLGLFMLYKHSLSLPVCSVMLHKNAHKPPGFHAAYRTRHELHACRYVRFVTYICRAHRNCHANTENNFKTRESLPATGSILHSMIQGYTRPSKMLAAHNFYKTDHESRGKTEFCGLLPSLGARKIIRIHTHSA